MANRNPIGRSAVDARKRRARNSAAYRAERERVAPFEELARLVIKHRASLGLSQAELARRVGTSHSAISRIESGRHKMSLDTLQRLAGALNVRLVVGFVPTGQRPSRDFVSL
jgi:ribosome-binding protein aMBF1 (putative translation factor)